MKNIILFFSILIANFISADDYYRLLGKKIKLIRQNNFIVIRDDNHLKKNIKSSQLLKNLNAKVERWPQQFKRANGKYKLLNINASAVNLEQQKEEYILPVFKNESGEFVFPSENIIVGFRKNISQKRIKELAVKYNLKLKAFNFPLPATAILTTPKDKAKNVIEIANKLYTETEIRWAHPDFIVPHYKRAVVNDPLFYLQWHLTNDGTLAFSVAGADAKVANAWDITMGTSSVRVCIYDDAVEKGHEDLVSNFVAGLDLDTMGPDPSPQVLDGENAEIHGTSCAGVALARGNNGIGVSGAAPLCSLMGIRWGTFSSSDAAGFFWAKTNGADIISCSWGTQMNDTLYEAIRDAAVNGRNGLGIPIFFAAGNDNDFISPYDPARHPNVICVVASNSEDKRANYSSYGSSVSIAAPSSSSGLPGITTTDYMGEKGYSSDNYCYATDGTGFGGTSSATPLAAGIAALCLSVEPNLTYLNVKALLQETADKIASNEYNYINGWNQYLGYGRINSARAVAMATGYTNTPSEHGFEMTAYKGKINFSKNKLKLKLYYDTSIGIITNAITVRLDGVTIAQFNGGESNWKWNKKNTRGKNKNATKDLIKIITGKPGKNIMILKIKNFTGVAEKEQLILDINFHNSIPGSAYLMLDSKGKIIQYSKIKL